MSLHYLEKHEPRKLHLFTKTLHVAFQPNTKHIQIITCFSLNHPSLLLGYVSNSVNASCCLWMTFFIFLIFLFKHQRQRAEATYMPVKSVQ